MRIHFFVVCLHATPQTLKQRIYYFGTPFHKVPSNLFGSEGFGLQATMRTHFGVKHGQIPLVPMQLSPTSLFPPE